MRKAIIIAAFLLGLGAWASLAFADTGSAPDASSTFATLYADLRSGAALPAVGAAVVLLVLGIRASLGSVVPWFKSTAGGYVLGFATPALLYVGTALEAHQALTVGLMTQALGVGWTAAGGYEHLMDVVTAIRGGGAAAAKAVGTAALVLLVAIGMPACAWWSSHAPAAKTAAVSCAEADVTDVISQVMTALHAADYTTALTQLGGSIGTDVLDCALKTIAALFAPPPGSAATPEYIHATAYLQAHGVEFAEVIPLQMRTVVLVDVDVGLPTEEIATAAAAMSVQMLVDFAPFWGVMIAVRAATSAAPARPGEWVHELRKLPTEPGALAYHARNPDGSPILRTFVPLAIASGIPWTVPAAHENMEAGTDPFLRRCVQAPDGTIWCNEVADAVEQATYQRGGVTLSNFCTPAWFEPALGADGKPIAGEVYDYLGNCTAPFQILDGGYGQTYDPSKGWTQVGQMSAYRQTLHDMGLSRTARRAALAAPRSA